MIENIKTSKSFNEEKGFTVVEILSVIAISGIILTTISSLYMSTFNGYNEAQKIVLEQQNITTIKNYFDLELRNAVDLKLLTSLPAELDSNYNYIYIDNTSLYLKNNSANKIISNNINTLQYEIIENNTGSYNYYLKYTLNNQYISTLILNNIQVYNLDQSGAVIAYKKP